MNLQSMIIEELKVKPIIEPKKEIRNRVEFLKDYLKLSGAKGFVLGISGGQDSTLAGKLAQLAVKELREEGHKVSFTAVRLPYKNQTDEDDAQLALQFIEPDIIETFNIESSVASIVKTYNGFDIKREISDFNKGNVKARTRMIVQYLFAGENNLLVIGTDHAAEAVTGFFTKYGDGGADILPLSGLNKRQGRSLLIELQAPERLYLKIPTADLLDHNPQQTDEHELNLSYDEIDDYLEGQKVNIEAANKIEKRFLVSKHKRNLPATIFDTWWK